MSGRAFIDELEARQMFAGEGELAPYDPYQGTLMGQFTSRVPLAVTGGGKITLALKVTNITNEVQRGLIDLTFVLDKVSLRTGTDGVTRRDLPKADKFDPRILEMPNVTLDLKPKKSQVFKFNTTLPVTLPVDEYWIAVAVDQGGSVAAGRGFGSTIGAAPTVYTPGFSDVTVKSFNISLKKNAQGVTSGTIKALLKNFGNYQATGNVTLKVYAAANDQASSSDTFVTQQTVTLSNLKAKGTSKTISIAFDRPNSLPAGSYFIRIELIRTELPADTDDSSNRNVFTRKKVPLT